MFQSIWDDVKREFRYGNMVSRIIIVNCSVFVVVVLMMLILKGPNPDPTNYNNFLHFFCMSSDWRFLLTHPWIIVTSAFLHEDFWHLLWNMLAFYWFGRIAGDLLGNHRILPLYLLGALAGNAVYFLFATISPFAPSIGIYALGASAAVMAMMACAAFIAPDYIFNVILIGPVKLKYIALVLILLDLTVIANHYSAGGSFAHLGGAAMGLLYAARLREGTDLGRPIVSVINFFGNLFTPSPKKTKFTYQKGEKAYARTEKKAQTGNAKGNRRTDTEGVSEQERLDMILDKIKERGYESLTKEEKEFLFNASKK